MGAQPPANAWALLLIVGVMLFARRRHRAHGSAR
jgi:MYXO-CTERM domain-containing protein